MKPTDDVTTALRDDIIRGTFPPGGRLVEIQLAQRYGCGRAAVRDALIELDAEGLVERTANRGATVRQVSATEAIQITEARGALESLVAAHAARHATSDERRALRAIVDDMARAVEADDHQAYSALNRTFHERLRQLGRHEVAAEMVRNLRNRSAHHRYQLALMPGRSRQSLREHAAIAEAIDAGDEHAAAVAMARHLASVADVLRQWGDAIAVTSAASER